MLVGTWGGMVWVRRGSMGAKLGGGGGEEGGEEGGEVGEGRGEGGGEEGGEGGGEGGGNSEVNGWARKGLSDQRWVLSCCWGCCRWEVVSGAGRTAVSFLGGGGGG